MFLCNFLISVERTVIKSSINTPTSSSGRRQFSLLKANRVTALMPRRAEVEMVFRTAATPFLWPKTRGFPCAFAQRPLPSIMTAICLGNTSWERDRFCIRNTTNNQRGARVA
ncbi:Uncharacterised protein [Vibrio cholerae]|nr:Uncharacterised protein [Vibrio cholerae]